MENFQNDSIQKQNVGNAGEYYIAARLSALDFVVTITLGRAEKYDILALNPSGKLFKLSVKTTQLDNAIEFPLSAKDEQGSTDDFYYAFVKLNKFKKEPDFWVIPSTVVCKVLADSNNAWLKTPGRCNKVHKPSTVRVLPIVVRESQVGFYPKGWGLEMSGKYYKNLSPLL
ncbi:MAG: hypothetical protein GXY07_11115 [Candidatus Hydrogenedentes bacterium]|nr:hypothetical protein [Candidatus Hydrogenedentota bacterium]